MPPGAPSCEGGLRGLVNAGSGIGTSNTIGMQFPDWLFRAGDGVDVAEVPDTGG